MQQKNKIDVKKNSLTARLEIKTCNLNKNLVHLINVLNTRPIT